MRCGSASPPPRKERRPRAPSSTSSRCLGEPGAGPAEATSSCRGRSAAARAGAPTSSGSRARSCGSARWRWSDMCATCGCSEAVHHDHEHGHHDEHGHHREHEHPHEHEHIPRRVRLERDVLEKIERALPALMPAPGSLLVIENVGNLVCPALFDLGEHAKVLLASVTEGDDKPLKYPHMFRAASLVLLNKIDLLPHVPFDPSLFAAAAREVNPRISVLHASATRGD